MDTHLQFTRSDIDDFEKRFRGRFVNSLSGFKGLNLIGTVDEKGKDNLAIFSSVIHLGSNPPLQAFINRPDSVDRHTLENIKQTKFFSLNLVNEKLYRKAHQTSARYSKEVSEFDAVGINRQYLEGYDCPFVLEAPVKTLMKLKQVIDIEVNGTVMVIGEIIWCSFPSEMLHEDGYLDLSRVNTVVGASLDGYYRVSPIERLSYAKPDVELTKNNL